MNPQDKIQSNQEITENRRTYFPDLIAQADSGGVRQRGGGYFHDHFSAPAIQLSLIVGLFPHPPCSLSLVNMVLVWSPEGRSVRPDFSYLYLKIYLLVVHSRGLQFRRLFVFFCLKRESFNHIKFLRVECLFFRR